MPLHLHILRETACHEKAINALNGRYTMNECTTAYTRICMQTLVYFHYYILKHALNERHDTLALPCNVRTPLYTLFDVRFSLKLVNRVQILSLQTDASGKKRDSVTKIGSVVKAQWTICEPPMCSQKPIWSNELMACFPYTRYNKWTCIQATCCCCTCMRYAFVCVDFYWILYILPWKCI